MYTFRTRLYYSAIVHGGGAIFLPRYINHVVLFERTSETDLRLLAWYYALISRYKNYCCCMRTFNFVCHFTNKHSTPCIQPTLQRSFCNKTSVFARAPFRCCFSFSKVLIFDLSSSISKSCFQFEKNYEMARIHNETKRKERYLKGNLTPHSQEVFFKVIILHSIKAVTVRSKML